MQKHLTARFTPKEANLGKTTIIEPRHDQERGHRGPVVEAIGLKYLHDIGQMVIVLAIWGGQLRILLFASSKI